MKEEKFKRSNIIEKIGHSSLKKKEEARTLLSVFVLELPDINRMSIPAFHVYTLGTTLGVRITQWIVGESFNHTNAMKEYVKIKKSSQKKESRNPA
jgi:hypothetical protein